MFKALKSFSGIITAQKDAVISDIKDKKIEKSLLNAGYIEKYTPNNDDSLEMKKLTDEIDNLKTENLKLTDEINNLKIENLKLVEESKIDKNLKNDKTENKK